MLFSEYGKPLECFCLNLFLSTPLWPCPSFHCNIIKISRSPLLIFIIKIQDFSFSRRHATTNLAENHHHVSGYSTQEKPTVAAGHVVVLLCVAFVSAAPQKSSLFSSINRQLCELRQDKKAGRISSRRDLWKDTG